MNSRPGYPDIPARLESIRIGQHQTELYIPEAGAIKSAYDLQLSNGSDAAFPYWAKIWPASIALAQFLEKRPSLYRGKAVVELAAGLGLPSLFAAKLAKTVSCSDYEPDAVAMIEKSILHNRFTHAQTAVLDWNTIREPLPGDILLLSDINYDPNEFSALQNVLTDFLGTNRPIILSTPQRLVAKSFIQSVAGHISESWDTVVEDSTGETPVSVFILA